MTWIKTIPYEEADEDLRRVYDAVRALYPKEYADPVAAVTRADGTSDSIVAAHSLIPEAMWHMMSGFAVLLQPHLPLSRRVIEGLRAQGASDIKVVVGGIIPPRDVEALTALGVHRVFPMGTPLPQIVAAFRDER